MTGKAHSERDQTEEILKAAQRFGIKHIIYKARANSKVLPKVSQEFPAINDFNELLE